MPTPNYTVLIIEDEKNISDFMSKALKSNGYRVITALSGKAGLSLISSQCPDIILLDLGLPDIEGNDVIISVRKWTSCPIIVVSARTGERDKVEALDLGADDYITKPFKLAVFLSRINALLRGSENFGTAVTELNSGGICIRLLKGEVYKRGELVELTASEYKLLCLFMENPDQILSSEQILGRLWDCSESYIDNNSLTVYIRRLRTKIEDNPGEPKRIVTVRGMGYKWNAVD